MDRPHVLVHQGAALPNRGVSRKKSLTSELKRLERLIGILQVVANVRIKTGRVTSPFGTEIQGFEVSPGGSQPEVASSYEDIERIFKANPGRYKVREEREDGKFKRFVVETE